MSASGLKNWAFLPYGATKAVWDWGKNIYKSETEDKDSPATPAPPATPTEESPEMKAAAEEAARREAAAAKKRRGRRATILTGPQGAAGTPELTATTLLSGKTRLGQ